MDRSNPPEVGVVDVPGRNRPSSSASDTRKNPASSRNEISPLHQPGTRRQQKSGGEKTPSLHLSRPSARENSRSVQDLLPRPRSPCSSSRLRPRSRENKSTELDNRGSIRSPQLPRPRGARERLVRWAAHGCLS